MLFSSCSSYIHVHIYSHHFIHHLVPSSINSVVKTVSLNEDVNGVTHVIFFIICTFYTRLAKRDTMLYLKLTSIMKPDVVVLTGNCIVYDAGAGEGSYLIPPLQNCSNRRNEAVHLPDKMKCCESYTALKQNSNGVQDQLRPHILSRSVCDYRRGLVWLNAFIDYLYTRLGK